MILDKTIPQIKVDEFRAVLVRAYQRAGLLKPAVESKRADAFSDEVGSSGSRTDNLMLKPKSWSDGQYLSIFPHGRMHSDDMKDAARSIGPACASRDDQLILDALDSASTLSTVGALGADVTYETLVQVVRTLADKDINLMRYQMCVACPYFWRFADFSGSPVNWGSPVFEDFPCHSAPPIGRPACSRNCCI